MSYGNWNEVSDEYRNIYLKSRYSENARGMLELIPKLQSEPSLMDVIPGTSLSMLFLEIPGKQASVHVWCEQIYVIYSVYIDYPDNSRGEVYIVDANQVVNKIKECVEQLRALQ